MDKENKPDISCEADSNNSAGIFDTKLGLIKPWRTPVSTVGVISAIVFCIIFAFALERQVFAQGREQASPAQQYSNLFRSVFEFIQRHHVEEIDPQVLFEGAMTGMFEALGDPYSSFLPEAEMARLRHTTQGRFGGVGLYVSKPNRTDGRPNYLEVAAPIEGTPGWRAGINPGDQIILIDGESTDVMTSDEAVSRLRGQPGTEVNILIRRGEAIEFPVTLVRAVIEVPTVRHAMIGDIGYIRVLTFTPMTAERSRDAIRYFQSNNYTGIILDLRNNFGGLLHAAVAVSNLFLDGGVVVSTRSRIPSENQTFYARGRAEVAADIPVIVLMNRGSASASEIVAGALKDRGRAFLVGENTFGKGSVQQVFPLENAGFKLTTAHYYTPSNARIDRLGIPPDRLVRQPDFSDADAEQLNALLNSGRIADFVRTNPDAASADRNRFAQSLNSEFGLDTSLLRRLIRNEQNRRTMAPIFDLEYDVQLQEAVRILQEEDFRALMRGTRSLRVLQDEAMQEDMALAS